MKPLLSITTLYLPVLALSCAATAQLPAPRTAIAIPAGVGAKTPFTTLEAEAGTLSGAAKVRRFEHGAVPMVATPEIEASGAAFVELMANIDGVSWTNPVEGANSIVVRASIPDAPPNGQRQTLNLYVDGKLRQAITLSSEQSWIYRRDGWWNEPAEGRLPFKFYNDDRTFITGAPLAKGATITLRKEAGNGAAFYHVDCIDLEAVAPPLTQPANSVSVLDFGADATGARDSQDAIEKAAAEATKSGKTLWIPAGTFLVSNVKPEGLSFIGITVQGAGMWHTTLYRRIPLPLPEGVTRWRSKIVMSGKAQVRDLTVDTNSNSRSLGKVSDYGIQATGDGWLVQRVWVRHCDAQWMQGSNGVIRDSRVSDSWGDGINLNNGNRSATGIPPTNLRAENNFVRSSGDDGFATFSDRGEGGNNPMIDGVVFLNNTSVASYWANGLRVAGGKNVIVRNNLVMDAPSDNGMAVGIFGKTGDTLESALIEGNVILRGGGWNPPNRPDMSIRHGMEIYSRPDAASKVTVRNNIIADARRSGVMIGGIQELVFENNQIINPAHHGIFIKKGTTGKITLQGNVVSGLRPDQLAYKNEADQGVVKMNDVADAVVTLPVHSDTKQITHE